MLLKLSFICFISTFGFGIVFNIRGKKLFYAALGGGISWFFYSLPLQYGFSEVASLFISSIIFSTYSEIMARVHKTPVTTFIICALLPLVPGSGMYYTMQAVVNGNISKSIRLGLNTIAFAGTLALGVIFVSTITSVIVRTKHKKLRKRFWQN